jgi:aminopeptidase N
LATEARSSNRAAVVTTSPGDSTPESTTPVQPPTTGVGPVGPDAGADPNGVGDSLFPSLGNPGLDVEHYDVVLDYDPATDRVAGAVHLDVVMTENRATFTLDSDGPEVSAVTVDGVAATFTATPPELLVTPAGPLSRGQRVGVDVSYVVSPQPIDSASGQRVGWFNTAGGSYVLNEPEGAHTWLPSNDHPSDKATFRFEVTVPAGVTAVANGAMLDHTSTPASETWIWQEDRPMATYLVQLLTGDYELVDGTGPNGLPLVSAVLRKDRTSMQPYIDTMGEQIDYFDEFFGPYPLDRYGIAVTDSYPGLAMETLGRSLFSREDFSTGRVDLIQQLLLSHELAHQWFGDAVSPARWTDVWLNESFATYGQWMWLDHLGMLPIEGSASAALAGRQEGSSAAPRPAELFGFNSYDGGAVILHALRKTIGDDRFFTLLRRWVAENNGQSRTTEQFVTFCNEVAGQDLTEFFDSWLYADVLPDQFPG